MADAKTIGDQRIGITVSDAMNNVDLTGTQSEITQPLGIRWQRLLLLQPQQVTCGDAFFQEWQQLNADFRGAARWSETEFGLAEGRPTDAIVSSLPRLQCSTE